MLREMRELEGAVIRATDGDIGHVRDLYFDDEGWVVRYLVVETGSWLSRRKVLISPVSIGRPSWMEKVVPVALTREQVRKSPDFDTEKPVSRQFEIDYLGYYGYPHYWSGAGRWGIGAYPEAIATGGARREPPATDGEIAGGRSMQTPVDAGRHPTGDRHLRSSNAVMTYHIHAVDGEIGHVRGMMIDDETWAVRYIVVDTGNWWIGHQVLIAPPWIQSVDWFNDTVSVSMTRQSVKASPAYDSSTKPDRAHELEVYSHYGRHGYWLDEAQRNEAGSLP